MIKFIASGLVGAVTMAGAGYNYVSSQNAKIESAERVAVEARQDAEAAKATLHDENAVIDHIMMELRDLRGLNAK